MRSTRGIHRRLWIATVAATLSVAAFAAIELHTLHAASEPARPIVIEPNDLEWSGPPNIPELCSAWAIGAEDRAASYALRVRLRKGGRIPPHTHPDERHTTVLSGTLYVGFGERFDESALVPVGPGQLYVAPAGTPHYVWAQDGDVEYQEGGHGPTGTRFVPSTP